VRRGLEIAILGLCGAALLATGITELATPQTLFTPLDLRIEGASALNEIRAAYGGMHVGIGVLLLVGAGRTAFRRAALWVGLAFLGGLAAGRLVSLMVDGAPGGFVYRLWIPEAVGAMLIGVLLLTPTDSRRSRNHGHP